jgi:tRNA threonylcarbamoyladenosine biosynthesis protein TsaE
VSAATLLAARTSSVDETRALAAAMADLLVPGDVLVLAGDLGAGKTAFTQGLGAGLGVTEPIVSPTFTIARPYEGRLTLHHLDVYRLEQMAELADVGLTEMLDDGAVVVIEWGDAIEAALPADRLELRFTFGEGDDDRALSLRATGKRWAGRQQQLADVLAPWAADPC